MNNNAVRLFLGSLMLSLIILVSACDTGQIADPELTVDPLERVQHTDPLVQYLVDEFRFESKDIVDKGDYYAVEEDIVFEKNDLQLSLALREDTVLAGKTSQRASPRVVSYSEIQNVTVRVDASIPCCGDDDDWREAVESAVSHWNGVSNSVINLVYTTAFGADIVVRSDYGALPDQVIADAKFATASGYAGNRIRINLDFNDDDEVTDEQKRWNIIHELGHTIGFAHTDTGSFTLVPFTPSTDNLSIMNSGTALFSCTSSCLSSGDKKAGLVFYPSASLLSAPTLGSMSPTQTGLGGTYQVLFTGSYAGDTNTGKVELWRSKNGGAFQKVASRLGNSAGSILDFVSSIGSPTYTYKVRAGNYGEDYPNGPYSSGSTSFVATPYGGGF